MIAVDYILRSYTLGARLDCNRHTVFVTTADKRDITALQAQITRINVSRHIYTGKMADMNRSVGIRESCCD